MMMVVTTVIFTPYLSDLARNWGKKHVGLLVRVRRGKSCSSLMLRARELLDVLIKLFL